jgi:hypothetical protein
MKIRYVLFLFLLGAVGCSSSNQNPDKYHVGWHKWQGDSVVVQLFRTNAPNAEPSLPKIEYECLSCNLIKEPARAPFDDSGVGRIFIPEAHQLLSARIRLTGSGIDTTFIQKQRAPEEAVSYFALSRPLVGRVLVNQLALLYSDTTQDSVVTTALIGDELNIFGTTRAFFAVHHPRFPQPLYLLREQVVRLY